MSASNWHFSVLVALLAAPLLHQPVVIGAKTRVLKSGIGSWGANLVLRTFSSARGQLHGIHTWKAKRTSVWSGSDSDSLILKSLFTPLRHESVPYMRNDVVDECNFEWGGLGQAVRIPPMIQIPRGVC
ncbi:hypothetical protein B0H14DRAFT_2582447 [Mycena olivaceomarginata]|nr:hypothetical protein B0H14DRAFT_2582447 [Mycena olivaceomarginata]